MADIVQDEISPPLCVALTRENEPCQNYRYEDSEYCYVHRGHAKKRCQAFTQDGSPCLNYPMADSDYCNSHQSAEARNRQAAIRDETAAIIHELEMLTADLQTVIK